MCVRLIFFFTFLSPSLFSSVIWQWIKDKTRDGTDLLPGLCSAKTTSISLFLLSVLSESTPEPSLLLLGILLIYKTNILLTVIRSEPGRHWLVWHQFHICSSLTASWITEIHMKINVLSDVISVLLRCWKSKKPLNIDMRRLHFWRWKIQLLQLARSTVNGPVGSNVHWEEIWNCYAQC